MGSIVDIQMARLQKLLDERKIELELEPSGRDWLAEKGWDPAYGARPLKRALQRMVENPLAMRLLEGVFADGDRIRVDAQNGELVFEKVGATEPARA
jgi:ATP-dependent Clp protease ATP-binding subunit ClpB